MIVDLNFDSRLICGWYICFVSSMHSVALVVAALQSNCVLCNSVGARSLSVWIIFCLSTVPSMFVK
jgi:hypothetical protein